MDLLAAGRSLDEVGRGLTWKDIRVMLTYFTPDSFVGRKLKPKEAARYAWTRPQMYLLGIVHDSLRAQLMLSRGIAPEELPQVSLMQRVIESIEGDNESQVDKQPQRRGLTAAEIRARVKAQTRSTQ